MPAAPIVAAGVTAAGALGGAAMANHSQGQARDQELAANREALAYQRERDAKHDAAAQAQWNARQQVFQALLRRYGVTFPEPDKMGVGTPQPGVTLGHFMPGGAPPAAGGFRPSIPLGAAGAVLGGPVGLTLGSFLGGSNRTAAKTQSDDEQDPEEAA